MFLIGFPFLYPGAETSMTVAHGESSPERLGGALRRLHYRATRRAHSAAARHHTSTPKVELALERHQSLQKHKYSSINYLIK